MITIEKNIKIPESKKDGRTEVYVYPFTKMQVGDSFWVNQDNKKGPAHTSCMSAARRCKARHGFNFVADRENGGIRVWRTS